MNKFQHPFSTVKFIQLMLGFAGIFAPFLAQSQLSVDFNLTSPSCHNWTDGTVMAVVTGGEQPYSYTWSNGLHTSSLYGVGAGTYAVTIIDAAGTSTSGTTTLTDPDLLVVHFALDEVCSGNGNATATASGGTGPYSFAWDDGSSGSTVTGLTPGLHCATVTDAKGCQAIDCFAVPAKMQLEMIVKGLPCYNFCDASVEAVVTGGTGPFTYIWNNGATGSVNDILPAGDYTVTVTDVNGCTLSGTATVDNPTPIIIDIEVTNPACGSGGTGSAVANVSGGTGPYFYLWSTGATTSSVSGLTPGNYSLTVTDFFGCIENASVAITPFSDVTLSTEVTPSSGCGTPDGIAKVIISGGTAPYNILWSNGAVMSTVTGLAPGTYTVVVTDFNGCGATAEVTIEGTSGIDLMITGVNAGCVSNGSVSAMVTPGTGTPPFTYLWNTGATTSILNNLTPGTYAVTVTDAAGCTISDSVTITASAEIAVVTSGTNVSCYGGANGSATATASGGAGPYTYSWNTGASGATITNLSAATYFVTATDQASGCTAMTNVHIGQPTTLTIAVTSTDPSCNNTGGAASASASGGTAPYSFAWSNGASSASISSLSAGTYTVTATDANSCTATASVTIAQGTDGPSVSIEIDHPVTSGGHDGALTATATGGTAPYTFLWSNGATTASVTGLSVGSYTVTVTDANGCIGEETIALYVPGCIGDRIWTDINRNGCQDPGEFGKADIKLTLAGTDIFGNAVTLTTTTAPNGQYLFANLAPGTYQVQIALPAGLAVSPAHDCGSNFIDSDFDANGNAGPITIGSGQCNTHVDGGLYDDCLNVTDVGAICCDQVLCGPGNIPALITSLAPATGGGSPVEYMWMYTTLPGPFNMNTWNMVPDAHDATYQPGPLYETTRFIRCAKAANCDHWLEKDDITITVDDDAVAEITGPDLVCVGDVVNYTAFDNGPGAVYSWNFGTWATPSTSNSPSVTVTWNSFGIAYVTLSVTAQGCTSSAVLPVAISSSPIICGSPLIINVNNVHNAVLVQWEFEKIADDYRFAVQRSADGENFKTIAVMDQSNSGGLQKYTYADYSPKEGNAFYRLEILDNNQHLLYSNVKRITRFEEGTFFLVYPNPVSDFMVVELSDKVETATQIDVFSSRGQLVQQVTLAEGTMKYPADFSRLESGVYFIRLTFNEGEQVVLKFVKE